METEPGKLFIGGISWDTSEERLRDYFQSFGEVVEAVIMKDRITGRARGFGFVVFADALVAEKIVRERHVIDGRTVEAKKAFPREDHQNFNRSNGNSTQGSPNHASTKKIFVGGLPSSITEMDFKRYFDQFGTITDVVVMYDQNTQRPRGFGFITYDAEEAVDKVLYKAFHELNGKTVEVKRAVPKELSSRTQSSSGYNYGAAHRVNHGLLNPYGHNLMSPVARNSPLTIDRSGYFPFGPNNYGMGLNLDSGLGLKYGTSVHSGLNHQNEINSYFSASSGRFNGPILSDINNGGSVSLPNATKRNIWGNGTGSIGEIWARSSAEYNISSHESSFRPIHLRSNGGNSIDGLPSSFSFVNDNVRGERLVKIHSFYSNDPWQSLPDEVDFSANIASNNQAGFIEDYSVTAR